MKTYTVDIYELHVATYEVEADSIEEAIRKWKVCSCEFTGTEYIGDADDMEGIEGHPAVRGVYCEETGECQGVDAEVTQ